MSSFWSEANPITSIRTVSLMLWHSFNQQALADCLDTAIESVLKVGIRTQDIAEPGMTPVGTSGMGDAIVAELLNS